MAIRYRILLMGAVFLIVFSAFRSLEMFPIPKDDAISQNSFEFSGVLRLWISEENSPAAASLASWLMNESARFEKKHDGVYVQITQVSAETLSSFSYAAELPPDMVVFSPGVLTNRSGLIQINAGKYPRDEFRGYEDGYAFPIAIGAHAWAKRSGAGGQQLTGQALLFEEGDEKSALYALLSDAPKSDSSTGRYGIDLGLPDGNHADIKEDHSETGEILPGPGSEITKNALSAFIKGKGDYVFLSSKTLPILINASSAPEFEIVLTGKPSIDMISLFGITDTPKGEKQKMCVSFLLHLLSEDAQKRLLGAGAFSVRNDITVYSSKKHYALIEEYLLTHTLELPGAFSKPDKANAREQLEAIIEGRKTPRGVIPLS